MKLAGKAIVLVAGLAMAEFALSASMETRTGCVMQTEAGWFTFCEPNACSEIKGAGVDAKLAGHKVTVTGTLQAETEAAPKTFVVTKVVKVGAACDERCTPRPPGHRGVFGNHDKPGSEGGTPGEVAPKPPPVPPPPGN